MNTIFVHTNAHNKSNSFRVISCLNASEQNLNCKRWVFYWSFDLWHVIDGATYCFRNQRHISIVVIYALRIRIKCQIRNNIFQVWLLFAINIDYSREFNLQFCFFFEQICFILLHPSNSKMDKLKRVLSGNDETSSNDENRGIMGDVGVPKSNQFKIRLTAIFSTIN